MTGVRLFPTISAIFILSAGTSAPAQQKAHPRLVDIATTRCESCHEDLLRGKSLIHAPAEDDCTTCHDVEISEAGTVITLTEQDPTLCLDCHDELEAASKGELAAPHEPVTDSCLTCHDPHAANAAPLLATRMPELCTDCHDLSDLQTSHGNQLTGSVDCRQCHLPHGSMNPRMLSGANLHPPFEDGDCLSCHRQPFGDRVRLRARGERLCTACHEDVSNPFEQGGSVHAALRGQRARAGCISCHNPHMSSDPKFLIKSGTELCKSCHEDIVKASVAETGHEVASDDCLNCHLPHRSEQAKLLNEAREELCILCHDTEDQDLIGAHLQADLGSLDCTSCHNPHGAGNPKLLAKTVHEPVLDGCDFCHASTADDLLEDGESALCLECHDDIGEFAAQAPVTHDAFEVGRCADCHNPHASAREFLVKAPSGGACLECHDEQAAGEGEMAHGVIDLIGCRACHEPHGGTNAQLLRQEGSVLCLACHDGRNLRIEPEAETVRLLDRFEVPTEAARSMASLKLSPDGERDHPVKGHRVAGLPTEEELDRIETTFEGELTCLTCHDPHKGRSQNLLVGEATSSMGSCLGCHPK